MARLPRHRRVDEPPPMRLTERDIEIIKTVHDFRVMRGDQIQSLFFGSQSTASFRLSRLYQHGFLDRHFLSSMGGLASSPPLYTVGAQATAVLRQACGLGPGQIRRPLAKKQLSPLFLEHMMTINTVRVAVTLAARQNEFSLEEWRDDAMLRSDYDRVRIATAGGRQREVSVIPDSYFVLRVPQGKAHFFLEVDRGTMTTARFRSKVLAYQAYIQSGQYQRRYQTKSLRILTITLSEHRLRNLKQEAEAVSGQPFLFTTMNRIAPESIFNLPIWNLAGASGWRKLIAAM
jgi:hypothetical protein